MPANFVALSEEEQLAWALQMSLEQPQQETPQAQPGASKAEGSVDVELMDTHVQSHDVVAHNEVIYI